MWILVYIRSLNARVEWKYYSACQPYRHYVCNAADPAHILHKVPMSVPQGTFQNLYSYTWNDLDVKSCLIARLIPSQPSTLADLTWWPWARHITYDQSLWGLSLESRGWTFGGGSLFSVFQGHEAAQSKPRQSRVQMDLSKSDWCYRLIVAPFPSSKFWPLITE